MEQRLCAAQYLSHHPPVYAQLPRHNCDRPYAELTLAAYLLDKFHPVPPGQPTTLPLPHPRSVPNHLSDGPKLTARLGQTGMPQSPSLRLHCSSPFFYSHMKHCRYLLKRLLNPDIHSSSAFRCAVAGSDSDRITPSRSFGCYARATRIVFRTLDGFFDRTASCQTGWS